MQLEATQCAGDDGLCSPNEQPLPALLPCCSCTPRAHLLPSRPAGLCPSSFLTHQEGKRPHLPAALRCHWDAAHQPGPVNQISPTKKATCSPLPAWFGVCCVLVVLSQLSSAPPLSCTGHSPALSALLVCVGAASADALWDIQLPSERCSDASSVLEPWEGGGGCWI